MAFSIRRIPRPGASPGRRRRRRRTSFGRFPSAAIERLEDRQLLSATSASVDIDAELLETQLQPWVRDDSPVLSALETDQEWAQNKLFSPTVLFVNGKYRMWYLGEGPWDAERVDWDLRVNDTSLGYAESDDGIHWTEFDANPILRPEDIPWIPPLGTPDTGPAIRTPYVLYDHDEEIYKLWFVSVTEMIRNEKGHPLEMTQQLGYATSSDGIEWDVWPEPIFESGRSPSVIKEGPNQYRMWMNSRPSMDVPYDELYKNIYEFTSSDGINWTRGDEPIIRPSGLAKTTIYPEVIKDGGRYYMWHGAHVADGYFEIFAAESDDGTTWTVNHDEPAFVASRDPDRFDGRYTSIPSVVALEDRLLLYFSARDLDKSSYRHIGRAELAREPEILVLTSPFGVQTEARPTFDWNDSSTAVQYDLMVKNLMTGKKDIRERDLSVSTFTPDVDLQPGNYRAYVRSIDADGQTSDWSAGLNFTIDPTQAIELHSLLANSPQPWSRRSEPVLSALTTEQDWASVKLYAPTVIFANGKFRMWYTGTNTGSRARDHALAYAESSDGINWDEYPDNPILTGDDIPWATEIKTPYVLFDEDDGLYKLWFVAPTEKIYNENGKLIDMTQKVGYATSADGIHWDVLPEPIYESGRSPSVIKEGPNQYRMWMNSRPSNDVHYKELYKNIYEFTSTDGINWTRGDVPVVQPSGSPETTIYPNVIKDDGHYYMWYGGHVEGGNFELFTADSADGTNWSVHHDEPALAATRDVNRFDGKYTSTPSVLALDDRLLLYYSARDYVDEYVDANGEVQVDKSGLYRHIGVAELSRNNSTETWPAPTLVSPSGTTDRNIPTFTWDHVAGAQHYDLLVKNLDTGERVLRNREVVGAQLTADVEWADGEYRVWVRAFDEMGRRSDWSAGRSFTISTQVDLMGNTLESGGTESDLDKQSINALFTVMTEWPERTL